MNTTTIRQIPNQLRGPAVVRNRPAWVARRPAAGRTALACWAAFLLFGLFSACAAHDVKLRFVNGSARKATIQPTSGWPLTLVLTANEKTLRGFGYPEAEAGHRGSVFPARDEPALWVFREGRDGDGCPSWLSRDKKPDSEFFPDCDAQSAQRPKDEPVLEFQPGLIAAPDPNRCSGQPEIHTYPTDGSDSELTPIGPCVGGGLAYGRNGRLPGLVVLADAGVGVVTDEHFNRPWPREARNLAGLFHSISYELKNCRGKTSILVHMHVPPKLFSPVMLMEEGRAGGCKPGEAIVRIDGELPTCIGWPPDAGGWLVKVRAFVVAGEAPQQLADVDRNGTVDLADAEKIGLKPLTREVVLKFTQHSACPCDTFETYAFDFDGDGVAEPPPCDGSVPGGPGQLEPPPR